MEDKTQEKVNLTEAEANEDTTEKGFTAYLELYGRSKMLCKVYAEFEGDPDELSDNDREYIVEYLQNISGIPETHIYHGILKIAPDDENEESEEDSED